MSKRAFGTVAAAAELARRRLPTSVYEVLVGGQESRQTADDNTSAFREIGFATTVSPPATEPSLATTIMGLRTAMPLALSPTGVQAIHPEGEVAVARAAAACDVVMGLSSFASRDIEDVARENPRVLYQVYWSGTRSDVEWRVERARAAGAAGLILTMDWCFPSGGRDRAGGASAMVPRRLMSLETLRFAGEVACRPAWFAAFARRGLPDFGVPNMATPGDPRPGFRDAMDAFRSTPPPSWEDVRWLGELWGGRFMVKGIMRVDDARRAVDAGATAISVSNHGGMNLDATPAAVRALPVIVEAVGADVEVLMDGGVRRGGDVAKALALGADAVMVGRAYLFALAADGQRGVTRMLDVMRAGLGSALYGLGVAGVADLDASHVVLPADFTRTLGASPSGPGPAVDAIADRQ